MKNQRQTGTAYEELAANWLKTQGFQILKRNYSCGQGEIDIIAKDNDYLVFIEVKYRKYTHMGYPSEAVHLQKQKKIIKTALYYCYSHKIPETQACRFDVISILGEKIEHIKNAFQIE